MTQRTVSAARRWATLGAACFAATANAQAPESGAWPARALRLVIPFAPGGAADTFGRLVAPRLAEALGQPVVADNRAGAGGLIGAELAAKSLPDGYTLVVSGVASHVLAPTLAAKPPFDPVRDVTHVSLFGGPPNLFAVHPSIPTRSLQEFIAFAQRRPNALVFGSPGNGTMGHLFGVLFTGRAAVAIEHVPYKSASGAVIDIVAGHIQTISTTLSTAAPQIRAGRVRPLAISAPQRMPEFPQLPTFLESGYPELVATVWFGLSGPAALPAEVVARLNAACERIFGLPEVRERLRSDGIVAQPLGGQAFAEFVAAELRRWAPVVRASGARSG